MYGFGHQQGPSGCHKPNAQHGKKETSILDSLPIPSRFRTSSTDSERNSIGSNCSREKERHLDIEGESMVLSKDTSPLWTLKKEIKTTKPHLADET